MKQYPLLSTYRFLEWGHVHGLCPTNPIAYKRNRSLPQYRECQYLSQHEAKADTNLIWNQTLINAKKTRSAGSACGDQQSCLRPCCSQPEMGLNTRCKSASVSPNLLFVLLSMESRWCHVLQTSQWEALTHKVTSFQKPSVIFKVRQQHFATVTVWGVKLRKVRNICPDGSVAQYCNTQVYGATGMSLA